MAWLWLCTAGLELLSRRLAGPSTASSDASIDASGCCRYINCSAVLVLNNATANRNLHVIKCGRPFGPCGSDCSWTSTRGRRRFFEEWIDRPPVPVDHSVVEAACTHRTNGRRCFRLMTLFQLQSVAGVRTYPPR